MLAVNLRGLVAEAQRADCVIEFAVQVGDFLGVEDALFYVFGNADALNEQGLRLTFDIVAYRKQGYRYAIG